MAKKQIHPFTHSNPSVIGSYAKDAAKGMIFSSTAADNSPNTEKKATPPAQRFCSLLGWENSRIAVTDHNDKTSMITSDPSLDEFPYTTSSTTGG